MVGGTAADGQNQKLRDQSQMHSTEIKLETECAYGLPKLTPSDVSPSERLHLLKVL